MQLAMEDCPEGDFCAEVLLTLRIFIIATICLCASQTSRSPSYAPGTQI